MQAPTSHLGSHSGFWGTPTSSIDWCEANYAHTEYICELFNTSSSCAMLLVGVLGVALHRRVLEWRILLAFASVGVVGLGSVAFHGTLLFELQMLDELPMLYTATLLVYILVGNQPRARFGTPFKVALLGYLAIATYGATFTRGQVQFWFFQVT